MSVVNLSLFPSILLGRRIEYYRGHSPTLSEARRRGGSSPRMGWGQVDHRVPGGRGKSEHIKVCVTWRKVGRRCCHPRHVPACPSQPVLAFVPGSVAKSFSSLLGDKSTQVEAAPWQAETPFKLLNKQCQVTSAWPTRKQQIFAHS